MNGKQYIYTNGQLAAIQMLLVFLMFMENLYIYNYKCPSAHMRDILPHKKRKKSMKKLGTLFQVTNLITIIILLVGTSSFSGQINKADSGDLIKASKIISFDSKFGRL